MMDEWDLLDNPEDDGWVEEQFGCPYCGERRVDYLDLEQTEAGDVVQCMSCHEYYTLPIFGAIPDLDSRREDYYQAGQYPPRPLI